MMTNTQYAPERNTSEPYPIRLSSADRGLIRVLYRSHPSRGRAVQAQRDRIPVASEVGFHTPKPPRRILLQALVAPVGAIQFHARIG